MNRAPTGMSQVDVICHENEMECPKTTFGGETICTNLASRIVRRFCELGRSAVTHGMPQNVIEYLSAGFCSSDVRACVCANRFSSWVFCWRRLVPLAACQLIVQLKDGAVGDDAGQTLPSRAILVCSLVSYGSEGFHSVPYLDHPLCD